MGWIIFVAGAVLSWGAYGALLHLGQTQLGNPLKALLCVGAIVADTEEEAQYHASSQRLRRLLRDTGVSERGPIPTPEDALARLEGTPAPGPERGAEWPRIFVGETSLVHEQLQTMASELKVDELMLITVVHNHEARKRSYELMAKAFGIEAQG